MSVKNGATIYFSQLVTERLGPIWIAASANGLVDIETEYDTVTSWTNSASDHGAVWADFTV